MASSLNAQMIRDTVLDAALSLANDPIPNIRFNVAKCLEVLAGVLADSADGQELIQRRIMPALQKLQQDQDADVKSVGSFSGKVATDSYVDTSRQKPWSGRWAEMTSSQKPWVRVLDPSACVCAEPGLSVIS